VESQHTSILKRKNNIMAELSKGAGIAIGLGITAAIGIGIYAIVKSKPQQQTIQLPSNYQQLPQYQAIKKQNPSLNEAGLAKLLSSLLKSSKKGGGSGGGSIGGGGGSNGGGGRNNNNNGYKPGPSSGYPQGGYGYKPDYSIGYPEGGYNTYSGGGYSSGDYSGGGYSSGVGYSSGDYTIQQYRDYFESGGYA